MDDGWMEYDIQSSNQSTENQLPIRNMETGDPSMIPQQTTIRLVTLLITIKQLELCKQNLHDASLHNHAISLDKNIINLEQEYEYIISHKEQS